MELIILIGVPASGKTTFYRSFFAGSHVLVSKDRMPKGAGREAKQRRRVTAALKRGQSVLVDNTNLSKTDRAPLTGIAHAHGARAIAYLFEANTSAALERNARREGATRVPEWVIRSGARRLELPTVDEGFDEVWSVRLVDAGFEVRRFRTSNGEDEMKSEELDRRMRALEYYHTVKLLPGTWAIVRLDGRGFSRLTEEHFEKPAPPTSTRTSTPACGSARTRPSWSIISAGDTAKRRALRCRVGVTGRSGKRV